MALQPVAPPERVAILDVLRGGALFGVLAANVHALYSTRYLYGPPPPGLDSSPLDFVAAQFVELVISGKAMTLLTLLFGLGFALQLVRAEERGEDARPLLARRLGALLLIGASHVSLLWWGDVTWTYAVAGFALLAFRRAGSRTLVAWALVLTFVPHLVMRVPEIAQAMRGVIPRPADPNAFRTELFAAIHGTDRLELSWAHIRHAFYFVAMIAPWYFPHVIGRFLLGYYAGRRRLLDGDGAAHLPLFRRLAGWGLAVGVAGAAVHIVIADTSLLEGYELLLPAWLALGVLAEVAMLGLALAYASIAVLLIQRPRARRVLLVLAPVGRMPLTTYLCQSVAATFVFYGWGLDQAGRLGAAGCLGASIIIYSLQIAVAHLWLRRYRFGPAEWLWRTLAYGRPPAMR